MGMAKICSNCACYEVCIYANPGRTKECKLWKPEVVRCQDCKRNNMNGGDCNRIITMYHYDLVLELNVAEYIKLEHCSYGERKDND